MTTNNDKLRNELSYVKQVLFSHIDGVDGRSHMRAGRGHDGFMSSQQVDYISGQTKTVRFPANSDLVEVAQGRYYGMLTDLKPEDRPVGFPTSSFILDAIGRPSDTRIVVLTSHGAAKQYIRVAKAGAGSGMSEWRENSVRLRLFRGSFSAKQNGTITFAQEVPSSNNVSAFTSYIIWGKSPSGLFSMTLAPDKAQQKINTVGIDGNNNNAISADVLYFTMTNSSLTINSAKSGTNTFLYQDPYAGWIIQGIDAIQ